MTAALHRIPRDVFVRHVLAELERDAYTCSNRHESWRPPWTRTLRNLACACRWTAGIIEASRVYRLYHQHTMRYVDRLVSGWRTMPTAYIAFPIHHKGKWWATFRMRFSEQTHRLVIDGCARPIVERHSLRRNSYSRYGSTAVYVIIGDDRLREVLCDTLVYVLAGASLERLCARHLRFILIDGAMREERFVTIVYRGRSLRVVPRYWNRTLPYKWHVGSLWVTALDQHGSLHLACEMRKLYCVEENG